MAYFHKNLTQEKWNSLSKDKQILNIAAELLRAKNSLAGSHHDDVRHSLDRALELIDLTINDREKWQKGSFKELLKLREYSANFYFKERRSLEEFTRLIRSLLLFHPISAKVQI